MHENYYLSYEKILAVPLLFFCNFGQCRNNVVHFGFQFWSTGLLFLTKIETKQKSRKESLTCQSKEVIKKVTLITRENIEALCNTFYCLLINCHLLIKLVIIEL